MYCASTREIIDMNDQAMDHGLMRWRICHCHVSMSRGLPVIRELINTATDAKSYGGSAPRRDYSSNTGMGGSSFGSSYPYAAQHSSFLTANRATRIFGTRAVATS